MAGNKRFSVAREHTLDALLRTGTIFGGASEAFSLSGEFVSPTACRGGNFESPLETVRFNRETLRYESTDDEIREDDYIAQAMVVLTLARLEGGWGRKKTMQQLSIWQPKVNEGGEGEEPTAKLANLWGGEIETLKRKGVLRAATLSNEDAFAAFGDLYRNSVEANDKLRRRRSRRSALYSCVNTLAEQAAVQFALDRRRRDPHSALAAAGLIRLICQFDMPSDATASREMSELLMGSAHTSDSEGVSIFKAISDRLEGDYGCRRLRRGRSFSIERKSKCRRQRCGDDDGRVQQQRDCDDGGGETTAAEIE